MLPRDAAAWDPTCAGLLLADPGLRVVERASATPIVVLKVDPEAAAMARPTSARAAAPVLTVASRSCSSPRTETPGHRAQSESPSSKRHCPVVTHGGEPFTARLPGHGEHRVIVLEDVLQLSAGGVPDPDAAIGTTRRDGSYRINKPWFFTIMMSVMVLLTLLLLLGIWRAIA